ncbi:hypothetical protein BDZ85DRAFT_253023 [Elsinoe ampelina]|uniref:Uncharacterized protein n=1 Tax=Elsinoe ampelina TaxID=302913 RepID=A0A6A6G0D1_9PEZI|nr:hypothetical protein BDZ85DRAFT_253023 [Elsinoe ampelina]
MKSHTRIHSLYSGAATITTASQVISMGFASVADALHAWTTPGLDGSSATNAALDDHERPCELFGALNVGLPSSTADNTGPEAALNQMIKRVEYATISAPWRRPHHRFRSARTATTGANILSDVPRAKPLFMPTWRSITKSSKLLMGMSRSLKTSSPVQFLIHICLSKTCSYTIVTPNMVILSKPVKPLTGLAWLLTFSKMAIAVNYNDAYFGAFGPSPVSSFDVTTTDQNNPLYLAGTVSGANSYPTTDWPAWSDQVECVTPDNPTVTVGGPCAREAITQVVLSALMQVANDANPGDNFAGMRFLSRASTAAYQAYSVEDRGQGLSCPTCPAPYSDQSCPPLDNRSYWFRKPGFRFELKTKAIKVTCKKTCKDFPTLNEANVEATLRLLAGQMRGKRGQVANIQLYRPNNNREIIAKCRVTLLSDATPYGGQNWLGTASACPDLVYDAGSPAVDEASSLKLQTRSAKRPIFCYDPGDCAHRRTSSGVALRDWAQSSLRLAPMSHETDPVGTIVCEASNAITYISVHRGVVSVRAYTPHGVSNAGAFWKANVSILRQLEA